MNRFITIAWGKSSVAAQDSVKATGAFVKSARDWLGNHGFAMPWCWVQEHGDIFGQHCHLLLHVDPSMDDLFRPMPLRWVKTILLGAYEPKTLQCQKLATARSAKYHTQAYHAELTGKLHYMLKTAPAHLEAPLGMSGWGHKSWGQTCPVYGKRAAVFQRRRGCLNSGNFGQECDAVQDFIADANSRIRPQ
jgi:hypothetical protein